MLGNTTTILEEPEHVSSMSQIQNLCSPKVFVSQCSLNDRNHAYLKKKKKKNKNKTSVFEDQNQEINDDLDSESDGKDV